MFGPDVSGEDRRRAEGSAKEGSGAVRREKFLAVVVGEGRALPLAMEKIIQYVEHKCRQTKAESPMT